MRKRMRMKEWVIVVVCKKEKRGRRREQSIEYEK